jgi:hypothetical protein
VLFTNDGCDPEITMSQVLDLFFNGNIPSMTCRGWGGLLAGGLRGGPSFDEVPEASWFRVTFSRAVRWGLAPLFRPLWLCLQSGAGGGRFNTMPNGDWDIFNWQTNNVDVGNMGQSKYVAILGSGCSGTTMEISKVVAKARKPQVSAGSTSPALTDRVKFPFFWRAPQPDTNSLQARPWLPRGPGFREPNPWRPLAS